MGLIINIIIIISALIIILSLYFLIMRRREKENMGNIDDTEIDMEMSQELGIEEIPESVQNYHKKYQPQNEDYNWTENELKYKYNKTLIRLVSRDPSWLYAYWEVTEPEFYQNNPVLRLINENKAEFYDINIDHQIDNWYISGVKPKQNYKVAIGYEKEGTFYSLCESKTVYTPTDRPSDNLDEKWLYIKELSRYQYRIDINSTLSLVESLEKRKEKEKLNVSSPPFN